MKTERIGFLVYDGFMGLDVFGPLEVFAIANRIASLRYELILIGESKGKVQASSGISVVADQDLSWRGRIDTLVIPGGLGYNSDELHQTFGPWLEKRASRARRVVSVCTGAFLLAGTGLINGQESCTHWGFISEFKDCFPKVEMQGERLYVGKGKYFSSAGVCSGMDLTLSLVEQDCGVDVAIRVARYLVVNYRRSGNQNQYSKPLQAQEALTGKLENLSGWVLDNLTNDIKVEDMAEQAGMSLRTFHRQFREATGKTPAAYLSEQKLDYGRQLLAANDCPIEQIAETCGYRSVDVFRRAFEKRFKIGPKQYRKEYKE